MELRLFEALQDTVKRPYPYNQKNVTGTEISGGTKFAMDVNLSGIGGDVAFKITDGTNTVTITDVGGKYSLDVNVTDITLNHNNDSVSLGQDGDLVNESNPLYVTLPQSIVDRLAPEVYPVVAPQTTRFDQEVITSGNQKFTMVGGKDVNNGEYKTLRFDGEYLRIFDDQALTYMINGLQKTKIVDPSNLEINSLADPNAQRALMVAQSATNWTVSSGNTRNTAVAATTTWNGTIENRGYLNTINVTMKPTGTNGILTIEQYNQNAPFGAVSTWTFNLGTSDPVSITRKLTAPYFRVSYQNLNGTPTPIFDLQTYLTTSESQTTLGNHPVALNEVNGVVFNMGQQLIAQALPVVNAAPVSLAFVPATAAINYNYLTGATSLSGIGSGWFDATQYNSMSFSITSNNGVGVIQFEQTDDASNTVGSPWPVMNNSVTPAIATTSFTLLAGTLRTFVGDIKSKYIRVRVSTATTAQSNANTTLRQAYSPTRSLVSIEGTPAVTVTSGTITQVTDVSRANINIPFSTTDLTGTITTTTTSSAITPTFGCSFQVNINVTAASGTNPTMDVSLELSKDNGTTWEKAYDFARITTTGVYPCPLMFLEGTRIRYVQTIGGTTPSFTRNISRQQSSVTPDQFITQLIDRTVNLNASPSVTPWINTRNARSVQLVVNIASATVAPIVQLEATDDNGVTSDLIGTTLTPPIAGGTVRMTISGDFNAQMVRAKVTSAGTATVIGYVLIKGF